MEYQTIANLIGRDTSNEPSKFRTKNWVERNIKMNQEEHTMLIAKSNLELLC